MADSDADSEERGPYYCGADCKSKILIEGLKKQSIHEPAD
jgi:hypothetical protein